MSFTCSIQSESGLGQTFSKLVINISYDSISTLRNKSYEILASGTMNGQVESIAVLDVVRAVERDGQYEFLFADAGEARRTCDDIRQRLQELTESDGVVVGGIEETKSTKSTERVEIVVGLVGLIILALAIYWWLQSR